MGALLGLNRGVLTEICPQFVFGAQLGLGTYPGSYLPLTAPGYLRIRAPGGRIETSEDVSESPRAALSDGVTFGTCSGRLDGDMSPICFWGSAGGSRGLESRDDAVLGPREVKSRRPDMFWKARKALCPMGAFWGLDRGGVRARPP